MNLGELVEALEKFQPNQIIVKLFNPHSYRGYYDHIAFEINSGLTMSAGDLLTLCDSVMNLHMTAYKGGKYIVTTKTPVWIAEYGDTGRPLLGIEDDGSLILGEDD